VGSVLSGMSRETVQTHHDRLFKFFLDFFDFRRLSQVHEKVFLPFLQFKCSF
jgi:hypothetical protein